MYIQKKKFSFERMQQEKRLKNTLSQFRDINNNNND